MRELFKDPILTLISLSILFSTTSLLGNLFSAIVVFATALIIIMKDGSKVLNRVSVSLYFLFIFIVLIYSLFGKGTLNAESIRGHIASFISFFSILVISFHIRLLPFNQIKGLLFVALLGFLFSLIATSYVGFIDPMALRVYGFGELMGTEAEEANKYHSMGMMSYSLSHAMAVVAMGLTMILCYSREKVLRIVSIVMLAILVRLLYVMTITTALIMSVIGVAFLIAVYLSRGRIIKTLLIGVLFIIAFLFTGLSSILLDFSSETNMQIAQKFTDFYALAQTGSEEGQMGVRMELFTASLHSFLSNPLFGWATDPGNRTVIGGHAFFFDYLAYYGLFALLFFLSWWKEYKKVGKRVSSALLSAYYFSFLPAAGLITLKGESVCSSLPFVTLIFIQIVSIFLSYDNKNKAL